MAEDAHAPRNSPDPGRIRRAEREVDRVHLAILCACAALLAAVCLHYLLR